MNRGQENTARWAAAALVLEGGSKARPHRREGSLHRACRQWSPRGGWLTADTLPAHGPRGLPPTPTQQN